MTIEEILNLLESEPEDEIISRVNKEFFVSEYNGKVSIFHEMETPGLDGRRLYMISVSHLRLWVRKPVADFWLQHSNRRQYKGVVFAPHKNLGKEYYNLWRAQGTVRMSGRKQTYQ